MIEMTLIQKLAIWVLPLLFAITLHEVAHGFVASFLGDQTAKLSGRLSLNPMKHVDLIGTIILPLLMLALSNFVFGWAKPVPVDPRNLRHPRRDMALVALAGPVANLLMAVLWAGAAKIGNFSEQVGNAWMGTPLFYMGIAGISINVVLAVLNLLPIPPLDGSKMLISLLPPRAAYRFSMIEPYGFMILIVLLVSGILNWMMAPFVHFFLNSIKIIFSLY